MGKKLTKPLQKLRTKRNQGLKPLRKRKSQKWLDNHKKKLRPKSKMKKGLSKGRMSGIQ